jgi:hypothetical protein
VPQVAKTTARVAKATPSSVKGRIILPTHAIWRACSVCYSVTSIPLCCGGCDVR